MDTSSNHSTISPAAGKTAGNRWDTHQMVVMALMCAIGTLLSFIQFPLIPGITWLKYDAACVPAMVCGFAFGPTPGIVVGVLSAIIQGLIMGDAVGALMNIIVVIALILPSAWIYRTHHTFKGALVGLLIAIIVMIVVEVGANLIIDPFYFGMPIEAVAALIIPVLIPFNLAKACINALLTFAIYKSISNLITPRKKQVKGI
ncbi:MAG: ECF transporter S component [Eggerthellaceae bacterium]|jgi:riboflavin transporter FmnP|nr:ECF transporter S component [Eggerthellaceae bacterium]MCH4221070.1 ECF transporter S component [Eggerthellaceae bacterium]